MSWEMCLSQTFAIKCLDVGLLLRKTPTKGCRWPQNPRVSCVCNSPVPICCLFLVLLWEHRSRQGRQRHSQVPTMLPGHRNTDLGAAKVQILPLGATTTCSMSAFICRPPRQTAFHPAEHLAASRDHPLPKEHSPSLPCVKSTAYRKKARYFFF